MMVRLLDWIADGHHDTTTCFFAFVQTVFTGEPLNEEIICSKERKPWPIVMFLELAFFQFLLNFGARTFIVKPLARGLLLMNTNRPNKISDSRVEKFAQSSLEMLFYGLYLIFGYRLARNQDWLWPSSNWWKNQPDNSNVKSDFTFFYVAYCARYFQNIVMVYLEPRRKDFAEMVMHHGVTCLLIYCSYVYGYIRVGFVTMVLLDMADPFLHIAKQLVYIKQVAPKQFGLLNFGLLADIFFVIFALTFTVTRIILYPYVAWSCIYEVYSLHFRSSLHEGKLTVINYVYAVDNQVLIMQVLVVAIQLLQFFWFGLLLRAVKNVLCGPGELKDSRSDSEASDTELSDKER